MNDILQMLSSQNIIRYLGKKATDDGLLCVGHVSHTQVGHDKLCTFPSKAEDPRQMGRGLISAHVLDFLHVGLRLSVQGRSRCLYVVIIHVLECFDDLDLLSDQVPFLVENLGVCDHLCGVHYIFSLVKLFHPDMKTISSIRYNATVFINKIHNL